MGAFESGQSFLAGVLAKLPEAVRAQVKEALDKPEAKDAVMLIGDGTLARSDYSKQMDDLAKKETELDALKEQNEIWWADHQAAIQDYMKIKPEYDAFKKNGTPNPNPNPNPNHTPEPLKAGMTKEEIDAYLAERDQTNVAVLALSNTILARHYHMFQEPLDMQAVTNHAISKRMTLEAAYNALHGERVQAKHKEAEEKRFNDEVQKRLVEERRKIPTNQPFPVRDATPSPLDALTSPERKPADYTVDTALAEYDRLGQARQSSSG